MVRKHYKSAKNRKKHMDMIARNQEIINNLKREKSIAFLLGAGFSAPMRYPIGNQLNTKILTCTGDNFGFSPAGELCVSRDGTKPNLGSKNSYDYYFDFCKDAIHYYNDNIKTFDYEEFYDYLKDGAKNDKGLKELFEKSNYKKSDYDDFENYVYQIDNIYNQLVSFYLEDGVGKSWYDDEAMKLKPTFKGYTGFLNCIEKLTKENIINVHTLNHDLFFERLNNTEWINGELCDGFNDVESPFYGELIHENRTYKCRLERYTGKYEKKIRLYKLHGSKDYYVYYTSKGSTVFPETYIKSRWGIGTSDFYKEIRKNNKTQYENCSINYHPDFLTGTTSKISRYKEPLLYKKLFGLLKQNLGNADMLIVIGYGFKDAEINRYILEEFGVNKPCFIVDPYANDMVKSFVSKMGANAVLIEKHIENLQMEDFKL